MVFISLFMKMLRKIISSSFTFYQVIIWHANFSGSLEFGKEVEIMVRSWKILVSVLCFHCTSIRFHLHGRERNVLQGTLGSRDKIDPPPKPTRLTSPATSPPLPAPKNVIFGGFPAKNMEQSVRSFLLNFICCIACLVMFERWKQTERNVVYYYWNDHIHCTSSFAEI